MSFPTRPLGLNGPPVSAIGFGAMSIGGAYGQRDTEEHRLELLDRAYEIGERFWDTADVYFDSEDIIGKWFRLNKDKRDNVFLATKFGLVLSSTGLDVRSDPEYVKAACAKSLERLGVDHIDLYYCHRVDLKTPIEKTVEAMVELKKQGKIHHLGLSEISSSTLRRAHAIHPISAVQLEYSPFSLEIEDPNIGLLATCRELGVAVVAYSPIGRGFLTGAIKSRDDLPPNDFRLMVPKFSAENFPKIMELADNLQVIANKKGCTSGQVTLAWLMAQGDDIIPIPGTRSLKYVEENTAAMNISLTEAEKKEIRALSENAEIKGARYPESMTAALFADTPAL